MRRQSDKQDIARRQAEQLLQKAEQERAAVRFNRGLVELEEDRYQILGNPEFIKNISTYIYEEYTRGEAERVSELLEKLFLQLALEEKKYNDNILSVLEKLGTAALNTSNVKLVQLLCWRYIEVLKSKKTEILLSSELCQFIANTAIILVRSSLWDDVEKLLAALWAQRNKSFDTVAGNVMPVPVILSAVATNDVVEKILQHHNSGDQVARKKAKKSIKYLGEKAFSYLLNRLIYSFTKEERFLIMELVGGLGEGVIEEIKGFLDKDLPWYAIRNMVHIITEIGDQKYFPLIESYLIYPDLRVQQQIISSIIKLGGFGVEKRLAQALLVVHDEIKMKLIVQLGAYRGEVIANGLVDLVKKRESFAESIQDELLFRSVVCMRSYPFPYVVNLLKAILHDRLVSHGPVEKISRAITETIKTLEPQVRHFVKGKKSTDDNELGDFDLEQDKVMPNIIAEFMDGITSMLNKGEKEKASSIIYNKIIDSAKNKDFQTAEILRDKLLSINPDALKDVIRAAEIIEEEKIAPISNHHLEVWEDLYETMSTEEFDAFYYSLTQESYAPGEVIVRAGEVDQCLYFLNFGILRLSCMCDEEDTFLKRLKAGDVIGIRQFFSSSVWTITLTAIKETQLHVLSLDGYEKVIEKFPDIEDKILTYCQRKEEIPELVKMSGKDRRSYARYSVQIIVNNVLLDPYGRSAGKRVFQGEMIDISQGGLSFSIRISNKKSADLLLGRQIISEINIRGNQVLKCSGTIVSVRYQSEIVQEYSVHVQFFHEIKQSSVTNVLNLVL